MSDIETTISKTQYVFTVLHRTDEPPKDLSDALDEATGGHAVGAEHKLYTVPVPDPVVSMELRQMGNDGSFFDDDLEERPEETEHEYAGYDTPEILRDHLVEHHGFVPASARVLYEAGGHHLRTSHRMAHHQDPEGD